MQDGKFCSVSRRWLPDLPAGNRERGLQTCGAMLVRPNPLVETIIGSAIEVHRAIGPRLLESAYAACLAHELTARAVPFRQHVPIPVIFKDTRLECGYRADFVIAGEVLVELKSVERVLPLHQAQAITYARLLKMPEGLLINFNVTRLVDGVRRLLLG
jgi:GxxExxY protein